MSRRQSGSPKDRLHGLLGKRGMALPRYDSAGQSGPSHSPTYRVNAWVGDVSGHGSGRSKREAEQAAAASLLAEIESRGLGLPQAPAHAIARPPPETRSLVDARSVSEFTSNMQVALVRLARGSGSASLADLFSHVRAAPFGPDDEAARSAFLRMVQDAGLIILDEAAGEVLPMSGLAEFSKDHGEVSVMVEGALKSLGKDSPPPARDDTPAAEEEEHGPETDPEALDEDRTDDGEEVEEQDVDFLRSRMSSTDFDRFSLAVEAVERVRTGGEWTRAQMFDDGTVPEGVQRTFLKNLTEEGVLVRLGERHETRYVVGDRKASDSEILEIVYPGRYDLSKSRIPEEDGDQEEPSGSYVPNSVMIEIRDRLGQFLDVLEYQAGEISGLKGVIEKQAQEIKELRNAYGK